MHATRVVPADLLGSPPAAASLALRPIPPALSPEPACPPPHHALRSHRKNKAALRGARQKGAVLVDISPPPPQPQVPPGDAEGGPSLGAAAAPAAVPAGVLGGKFRLEAAEVTRLQAELALTEDQLLAHLIKPAASLARPPISSFHVG